MSNMAASNESEREAIISIDRGRSDVSVEDLKFQDFGDTTRINDAADRRSDKSPYESSPPGQTHTFTNFPSDDDDDEQPDPDKQQLLGGPKKSPPFWTFEYYMTFFDVDTYLVLARLLSSFVPRPKQNFLLTKIRPKPDLYGPFWVCATLIFTTAVSGNLANYFARFSLETPWVYDFQKVTLAAVAIFIYAWGVPVGMWAFLHWRNSLACFTFLEILCVYGYSLTIYIPISLLWVIPVHWLQWLLVAAGLFMSGTVLLITFYPAVKDDDKKVAGLAMLIVFMLHAMLSAGFMLYFFHVPSVEAASSVETTQHPVIILTTPAVPSHNP